MNRWEILAEKYFERPNGNSRGENKNTVFGYSKPEEDHRDTIQSEGENDERLKGLILEPQ